MDDDLKKYSARGEWYERGVNYGIFTCLFRYTTNGSAIYKLYDEIYQKECGSFVISDTDAAIQEYKQKVPEDPLSEEELRDLYHQAFLIGYDMMYSFLICVSGNSKECLTPVKKTEEEKNKKELAEYMALEIVYLQVGIYQMYGQQDDDWVRNAQIELFQRQWKQIGMKTPMESEAVMQEYCKKGRLFNADTLVLLREADTENPDYYLLIADEGDFANDLFASAHTEKDVMDQLIRTFSHQRMQGFFRNASIYSETEYSGADFQKAGALAADKPLCKTLQAAAYATSFLEWLTNKDHHVLSVEADPKTGKSRYNNLAHLTVVGITNLTNAVINLQRPTVETIEALQKMGNVYVTSEKKGKDFAEIKLTQQRRALKKTVSKSFEKSDLDEGDWSIYQKRLTGFANENQDLRKQHGVEFLNALRDPDIREIYACGAPGIGKTYSVRRYTGEQTNGIFGYQAPRTILVNEFANNITKNNDTFSYTTNSLMGQGEISAKGNSNVLRKATQIVKGSGITFTESADVINRQNSQEILNQTEDNRAQIAHSKSAETVMKRLSDCSDLLIKTGEQNEKLRIPKLAPALSTQSIGKYHDPNTEKKDLYRMFSISAEKDKQKEQIEKLEQTYGTVLWMIDEVSGDEHGIQISNKIHQVLNTLSKKSQNRINTKFVIADASLQEEKTIRIYSRGEIGETFFISKPDHVQNGAYTVRNGSSALIQCNAYPAKELNVTYKIAQKTTSKADARKKIEQDIWEWYETRDQKNLGFTEDGEPIKPQYILFLQNKDEIDAIKEFCDGAKIPCEKITSNTEVEKKAMMDQIINRSDGPAVILMTSSGARGISCKHVTTIACYVPIFQVASNLMEIVQAIYRGRGDDQIDRTECKNLIFYVDLSSNIKNDDADSDAKRIRKIRNNVDAMTMMLLIEGSIETRIYGHDRETGYAITPLGRQTCKNSAQRKFNDLEDNIARLERTGIPEIKKLCKYAKAYNGYDVKYSELSWYEKIYDQIDDNDRALRKFAAGDIHKPSLPIPRFIISNRCIIYGVKNAELSQTQSVCKEAAVVCQEGSAFLHTCEEKIKKRDQMGIGKNEIAAFDVVSNFVKEKVKKFSNDFKAEDENPFTDGVEYIAFPLAALGRKWENGKWYDKESDWDIADLLYNLMRTSFDVGIHLPRNAYYGYTTVPYLFFTSGDIKQKAAERFVNTEIITSNSINMLSLLFAKNIDDQKGEEND